MDLFAIILPVVIYGIGFLPMQRLNSRRATVISALLGLALAPIGYAILRLSPTGAANAATFAFVVWMMLVGIGIALGSGVRFYILGRGDLSRRDRMLITGILAVALAVLFFAALEASGTLLD